MHVVDLGDECNMLTTKYETIIDQYLHIEILKR